MSNKMIETISIRVKNVCFSYSDSKPILKAINLTVGKGEIYGLLGSSGCGKT